jgi:hypothetical protein
MRSILVYFGKILTSILGEQTKPKKYDFSMPAMNDIYDSGYVITNTSLKYTPLNQSCDYCGSKKSETKCKNCGA